jgi:hypothetical protein
MSDKDIKCVLCGKRVATTKDHVPPKGIFPKPRPNDLIKVPACFKCNHCASSTDEMFRVYLSLHVGTDTPRTKTLWEKHALRTINHNRKLKQKIIKGMKPVYVRSQGGIILGREMGILWDSEVHDSIITRTVRGLYFYHFGVVLPPESKFKINWHRSLTIEMEEMSRSWDNHSIANGDFQYRYGRSEESPDKSIWLFQFYNKHWASAHTNLI